jgi:hypothetical protein
MSRYHGAPIFPVDGSPLFDRLLWAFCAAVSFCLISHLWIRHGTDGIKKKIIWSAMLLVPIMGWVFYGAFYQPFKKAEAAKPDHER